MQGKQQYLLFSKCTSICACLQVLHYGWFDGLAKLTVFQKSQSSLWIYSWILKKKGCMLAYPYEALIDEVKISKREVSITAVPVQHVSSRQSSNELAQTDTYYSSSLSSCEILEWKMLQKAVAKQSSSQVCYTCQVNTIFFQLGSVVKKVYSNPAGKPKKRGSSSSAGSFVMH